MSHQKIEIAGLHTVAKIGVSVKEQKSPQPLVIDITLEADLSAAAESDHLSDTIDYVAIVQVVERISKAGPYSLIEALADKICREVLTDTRIEAMRIKVKKFPIDLKNKVESVAVELSRRRG
jgi:dihydroneopterin aldolase